MAAPGPLRLAAFQPHAIENDVAAVVQRLQRNLAWCDSQGVQLAIFPECFLQGYASDRATIAGRALALDGPQWAAVLAALSDCRCVFVLGLMERRDTCFYNTAVLVQAGRLLGRYAKTHPNEAGFDAGDAYPVFEVAGWRVGINICHDANFPEAALRLGAQGAQLLCYPLNNMLAPATAARWREKSVDNLFQRARDTGCWVVSSDVVGASGDKLSHGCTSVVAPDGTLAARVAEDVVGAAVFDIS